MTNWRQTVGSPLQNGQDVKVWIRPDRWVRGKVLGHRDIPPPVSDTLFMVGFGEYSSYQEKEFPRHDIKTYQPQTDEAHVANLERDLPIGFALAESALADLLPGEKVLLKVSDQNISGYHGAVTIDPVQYDAPRIGGEVEQTGYQVTTWKHCPSTRNQPEEYVDAPVGTYPNISQAVQVFIETIFKLKAQDYWQAQADAAQAAEWEASEQ